MPAVRTVFYWLNGHPDFLQLWERALIERAWLLAKEMIALADSCDGNWVETGSPGNPHRVCDAEALELKRLRIGDRKLQLSRLLPKRASMKARHIVNAANVAGLKT